MLIAGLLILSLLCAVAAVAALRVLRASERRRAELGREKEELAALLDAERRRAESLEARPAAPVSEETEAPAVEDEGKAVENVPAVDEADVFQVAAAAEGFFNTTTHPRELLTDEKFLKGVELLRGGELSARELLTRGRDNENVVVGCMALEALARRPRDEGVSAALLDTINFYYYWPRLFALRALAAHTRGPLVAQLVARLNSTWTDYVPASSLRETIAGRVAAGEAPTLGELISEVESLKLDEADADTVLTVLRELGEALPGGLVRDFERWMSERAGVEFLKTLGRVWESDAAGEVFVLDALAERVAEIEAAVRREPARSVLLVGESGVGKTATLKALAGRLRREHWIVFEASAADVLAGQQYVGQLEERVRTVVQHIRDKRVLWVVPNFHETLWAGRHKYSPVGVLDLLLPSIEGGAVRLVGEVPADAYEQLIRLRPRLRTATQVCRVHPTGDEETLELGRRWARSGDVVRASEQTLREALQLAKQYLGDKAAPGNLLIFLDATHRRLLAEEEVERELTLDDLLVTLSQLTGLPVQMLDERRGLDLAELRAFFERRVLGQPEAVECLTERVAMIKAGLTDPTRPQGVFLFVGPTGTGKTEIAKTLAEFLFGSPERMIRLDMSELQTYESVERILGSAEETSESSALVNQIRKQPFSVVLLDEFEKAHPQVWDLFLQVFDDGRLTDRRGNTADFRHCVVIMTSNLGATLPHGASVGFSQEQTQFAAGSVERAVGRAFRREFVNRIDRVVVFRPLGRSVMRDLLRKELNDVLGRRGLRTRQWAVEWDESAVEFLLEKGFTADLGARPLKRAVERYLLAPLALTIVNHQFPEGDQFLFVRSAADAEALDVQFVDPDAPGEQEAPPPARELEEEADETVEPSDELRVERIALDPRGEPTEVRFLQEKFEELASHAEGEDWRRRKEGAMEQMQSADFWSSPSRFTVLGLAEYMDRVEAGLDTAGSLLARLRGQRKRLPHDLVGRLAQQLYLLDAACRVLAEGRPRDAFLEVRAGTDAGADAETSARFARRVAEMYRRWAEKRRMRLDVLDERDGDADYRLLAAVSGYGAHHILSGEAGLHVLETPQDDKSFNRARALVRVAPQPDEPAGRGPDALLRQAEGALAAAGESAPQTTVRRYREEPSPLVRDSARGWRTGRLERVLGGDFDLIT
ncbi:MAG TPA: AAA family ATPase [Pyrinomonadaceae bacterium]|jgi:ATP-dependent Clp protease ATP-binding subunit ClpC|nr:AAA family ATPase [Pyrinomonadaceae bacterium]